MSIEKFLSDDLISSLGKRLLLVMEKNGLKQGPFAESIGISQGYLSDVIRGRKDPSKTVLIAIEGKYGYLLEWLLTGQGDMEAKGEKIEETDKSIRNRNEYEAFVKILCSAFERVVREGEGEHRKKIINDVMDYINELGPKENK